MRNLLTIIAFLFSFSVIAEEDPAEKLKWLYSANPVVDAEKALKNGNYKLKAVHGFVLSIPGTKYKKFNELKNKYGVEVIEGTSDDIQNKEHGKLNNLANNYAKQYNAVILSGNAR